MNYFFIFDSLDSTHPTQAGSLGTRILVIDNIFIHYRKKQLLADMQPHRAEREIEAGDNLSDL